MTYQAEVESAILQHLQKAFPHYQPGISTGTPTNNWNGLLQDINAGWGINFNGLSNTSPFYFSPATALAFWLGGQPDWRRDNNGNVMTPTQNSTNFDPLHPVRGFLGFSANPLNPFDGGPSHIAAPFFDFDIQRFNGLWYWPAQADGSKRPGTLTNPTCPIVYFRAENGNYTFNGLPVTSAGIKTNGQATGNTNIKSQFSARLASV